MSDVGPWTKYQTPAAPIEAAPEAGEGPWTKYQQAKPEPRSSGGIVSTIMDAGRAVKDAVVGQNEFDYPEIISAIQSGAPLGETAAQTAQSRGEGGMEFLANLRSARGEEGLVDVLKSYDPATTTAKDKHGNTVVTFAGNPYYLNRSGLSGRDVDEGVRDTLLTTPFSGVAGNITKGVGLALRAGGQAIAGLFGSVASDVNSARVGSQQGLDIPSAIASTIGGAGGEVAGTAISAIINRVRNNPARYVTANGTLTPQGEQVFAEAGLDPADVSERLAQEFARRIKQTGPTPATAREVAANEFGIPLTRGDATGDFGTIAFERAAEANARGEMAGSITRGRREQQRQAIDAAKGTIADDLGPGVATRSPQESAGTVLQGVRTREEAHGKMVSATYDQAADEMAGKVVARAQLKRLPEVVDEELKAAGVQILPDSRIHPSAAAAMDIIDKLGRMEIGEAVKAVEKVAGYTTAAGKTVAPYERTRSLGAVALDSLETIRKEIGGKGGLLSAASNESDRMRVRAIVKAYGRWLDDTADEILMSGESGVVDAVSQLKNARAAAAKHFSLFGERPTRAGVDDAGKTIERMIHSDVTEQEVANFLYGTSKIGDSGRGYRVAKRILEITGKDSDEWNAVRRGMWQRLVQNTEDTRQPGAQAVSENILKFVNGEGAAMANLLYTPVERAAMRRFANVLKNTIPPADAVNPSKSGYEVARALGDVFNVNAPFYIRIFGQVAKAGSAVRAVGGGAPPVRTPAPTALPAVGAVAGDRLLTDE